MYEEIVAKIEAGINPERSEKSAFVFGIAPGKYGEGDIFLGCAVPYLRRIAKDHRDIPTEVAVRLLQSPIHEFRFTALAILTYQFKKTPNEIKDIYLENLQYSNNWDIVDAFCWKILGQWCLDNKNEEPLYKLNLSDRLWHKRISVVSYQAFYRRGLLGDGLENIERLLKDDNDLIQKANGWMLREIHGRVDKYAVESFLIDNYTHIPRTTLRYAIEKFPEEQRLKFLHGDFK